MRGERVAQQFGAVQRCSGASRVDACYLTGVDGEPEPLSSCGPPTRVDCWVTMFEERDREYLPKVAERASEIPVMGTVRVRTASRANDTDQGDVRV